jgi:AP-1 complex subunit gamma-1
MECLNLISRDSFFEKRIGYLGITLLFSEKSEILMMATHRMRTDMECTNHYVQAIALQTLASISNDDMAKDLGETVGNLIGKGHSYVSKKACLTGIRMVQRNSELVELYIDRLDKVMGEKNHSLLLSALGLSKTIMLKFPETKERF